MTISNRNHIVVVGRSSTYSDFFRKLNNVVQLDEWSDEYESVLENADLVVFTGGNDIDPSLYGQVPHKRTFSTKFRDDQEVKLYELAVRDYQIPVVGICRGAQFLTAMNGGSIFQHVSHHTLSHNTECLRATGKDELITFRTSSTHHQMMNPFDLPDDEYFMIGHAHRLATSVEDMRGGQVTEYGKDSEEEIPCDPEIVLYPYTDSLCIQGHPEHTEHLNQAFANYSLDIIERHMYRSLPPEAFTASKHPIDQTKMKNVLRTGYVNKTK